MCVFGVLIRVHGHFERFANHGHLGRTLARTVAQVANVANLLYRRLPVGRLDRREIRSLAGWHPAIQRSAAKPQPKERGSVTRSSVAGRHVLEYTHRVLRWQRAAAHRAALLKIFAAREDFNGY